MRIDKILCSKGVWVTFLVLCLFLIVGDAGAQCTPTGDPLQISYSGLSMGCGASQGLSASGGCPEDVHRMTGVYLGVARLRQAAIRMQPMSRRQPIPTAPITQ